jgi:hypothetical protein
MKKCSDSDLHSALSKAIQAGYDNDFIVHADGSLYCCINPQKQYSLHKLSLSPILVENVPATLYLVTTPDGLHGTFIDFWD